MRRALAATLVLGGLASLLCLALPLYVLHVLESAIPGASLQTLGLLTLIAAGAAATLVCLLAARDRILLRSGLWLEHTLGRQLLERGERLGSAPAEIKKDADALGLLADALTTRAIAPALDAVWLPLLLAALALLHPIMGAIAALLAAALILVALGQRPRMSRLAGHARDSADSTGAWWWTVILPGTPGLPEGAPEQCERLSRARVAAVYALGNRACAIADLARLARIGAQIALIAAGAWLVIAQQLTLPLLVACVLITAILLERLERLLQSVPELAGVMAAYRRLAALAAHAAPSRGRAEPLAAPPRLNIRTPLAVALTAALLFVTASLGAAYMRLGDLAGLAGGAIFETRLKAMWYPRAAVGTRLLVKEGADVRAGDIIVTFDTAALDRQIAALRVEAETARRQLAQIGQETSSLAGATDRPKLASLEQRVGELESHAQELLERIELAERELAKSEIRAPVSGRVMALKVSEPDAAATLGIIELEIATADRPLLERLLEPVFPKHNPIRFAADPRSTP